MRGDNMVEAVLMNKRGAVITTDRSYVVDMYDDGEKIFNRYDKIYPILGHNIAIVVSGHYEFQDIPWEIVIDMWQNHLPDKLRTLQEYVIKFVEYLKYMICHDIPEDDDPEYLEELTLYVFNHISDLYSENENMSSNELIGYMAKFIESLKEYDDTINNHKVYSIIMDSEKIIKNHALDILDKYSSLKYKISLNDEFFEKLLEIIYLLSSKKHDHTLPFTSKITIVGYGEENIFPTLCSINIHGYINSELIFNLGEIRGISREYLAHIELFGQNGGIDDIKLFISGVNAHILNIQSKVLKNLLIKQLNELGINVWGLNDSMVDEFIKEYIDTFRKMCLKKYELPTYLVISGLSIDDLANFAESLMELPLLRKKYGSQEGIIKAPIDVAIITKNGFKWVKKR